VAGCAARRCDAGEKAAQIEKHERALSMDGWLKDPPRRIKLVPEKELTLGEEGLRRMRDLRESDLKTIEAELVPRAASAMTGGTSSTAPASGA
jgi:hypothetical protein